MPTFNEEALKKWREKNKPKKRGRPFGTKRGRKDRKEYYKENRQKILEQKRQQVQGFKTIEEGGGINVIVGEFIVSFD